MDLISIRDLEKKEIEKILSLSEEMEKNNFQKKENKILATLFFEPSTRTRLSFQSAALRLGMGYIDLSSERSSLKKGETFVDTIKVVSGYADIMVVRHMQEGAARLAADVSNLPVINGGDGGNQHPTQTLIDLYTIRKNKGQIGGLNIGLFGDLKHARTMHSLLYALAMFDAKITLFAPKEVRMDRATVAEIEKSFGIKIVEREEPELSDMDVLYMCRIQEERFADPYEAKRVKERFTLRHESLKNVKKELIILNPLPKLGEISNEIDRSPYAKYFDQAHYGIPVRMAIIDQMLRAAKKHGV